MMRQRWRLVLASFAAVLALLLVLAIDSRPQVPVMPPPGAEEVQQGRAAFGSFRRAIIEGDGLDDVSLSASEVNSIALLAGRAFGVDRIATRLGNQGLGFAASVALPAGLWLNGHLLIAQSTEGFPSLSVRVGSLPVPSWLGRAGVELLRVALVWRGAGLAPLDEMVLSLKVDKDGVVMQPGVGNGRTGLISNVIELQGAPVDGDRLAAIFCQLAAQQRSSPTDDLAIQLQRMLAAGTPANAAQAAAENRAGLVAVALVVAGKRALRLVDERQALFNRCPLPTSVIALAGRPDLAKHWAISAALAAKGGLRTGRLLGEWKELADSRAGGSGFSFVDLAADRAGLKVGLAATNPDRAMALRADLQRRSNADLLPRSALGLEEGMSQARFVALYGDTDSARFAAAVAEIDRLLARGNTPGASLTAS